MPPKTNNNSTFLIPNFSLGKCFTFSAKEKDSETGLSYFGSRYYSSDLSIWLSVDPMSDKYPSLSPYTYCADNPIKLVDPNGEDIVMNDDLVIRGANNSSVTIKTDLVNLDVSVASLGIDFGGNYSLSGNELLSEYSTFFRIGLFELPKNSTLNFICSIHQNFVFLYFCSHTINPPHNAHKNQQ